MLKSKYFDGVRQAQTGQAPVADLPPFDPSRMRGKASIGACIKALFLEDPRWWLAILRRIWPNPSLGGYTIVTRDEDVREVLERQDIFTTPYGPEMSELAPIPGRVWLGRLPASVHGTAGPVRPH